MTATMKAFHGDPAVKQKYTERLARHQAADQIVKGTYGGPDQGVEWRGCCVGCTLHGSDHRRYEAELGLPEWLGLLFDSIFEGLPAAEAPAFAVESLAVISVGADVDPVRHRFLSLLLRRCETRTESLQIAADIKAQVGSAVRAMRELHERASTGPESAAAWSAAWSAAESAARSAAESAWSAAWSAAESAARSAAWSAWAAESAVWAAESAARSAAESAWSAARSAARSAAESAWAAWSAAESEYRLMAANLIRLLRECV